MYIQVSNKGGIPGTDSQRLWGSEKQFEFSKDTGHTFRSTETKSEVCIVSWCVPEATEGWTGPHAREGKDGSQEPA